MLHNLQGDIERDGAAIVRKYGVELHESASGKVDIMNWLKQQ